MKNDHPLRGAILAALAIAAVVWATIGPAPAHKTVLNRQAIAQR
ncbi:MULTISPECIES: hypothetical protein [unclassified Bradyrhizobium]|nr:MULTISPECIES: hypothetical protein [unclassified Bradyrhizobium]